MFDIDERIQLLDGQLVATRPPKAPHTGIGVDRDVVHVHTDPAGQGDASVVVHAGDEPLDACGVTVALHDLRGG